MPSVYTRLRNLNQIYLGSNSISGSIPASFGSPNQPYFQVVALQNNTFSGTIPPGLVNGSNMCILLLNDNVLRGGLPPLSPALFLPKCTLYSGTYASSQFRPAVLVHNNRLSCHLPKEPRVASTKAGPNRNHGNNRCGNNSYPTCLNHSDGYPNGTCGLPVTLTEGVFLKRMNTTNSLFLAGNLFSTTPAADNWNSTWSGGSLPEWMASTEHGDPMTRGAPFLYQHNDGWFHLLSSFTLPTLYICGGALALALVTHGLVWRAKGACIQTFDDSNKMHGRTASLNGLLSSALARWSVPFLVLAMVPLYINGAKYVVNE